MTLVEKEDAVPMLNGSEVLTASYSSDVQGDCSCTMTLRKCGGFQIHPHIYSHACLQEGVSQLRLPFSVARLDSFLKN